MLCRFREELYTAAKNLIYSSALRWEYEATSGKRLTYTIYAIEYVGHPPNVMENILLYRRFFWPEFPDILDSVVASCAKRYACRPLDAVAVKAFVRSAARLRIVDGPGKCHVSETETLKSLLEQYG